MYQAPTTEYAQPTTTYNAGAVAGAGAGAYTTTTQAAGGQQYNGYCSTLYETGPGLPTTAAGDCGTVLVLQAGARASFDVAVTGKWLSIGLLVHVLLWVAFYMR